MKKLIAAALLLAAPAAAAAPSFADALTLCRTTFFIDADKGEAMFKALPSDDDRRGVALICLAYRQGALDALEAASRRPVNRT